MPSGRRARFTFPGGLQLTNSIKTTAIFLKPFELGSFNETLPAGEYELETSLLDPADWIEPGSWTASVLVHLHPRTSHPGLARTLTVPLAELERAIAKDKLTGKTLTEYFLEEMLTDPMIRLVMQADGVSETDFREVYSMSPALVRALGGATVDGLSPRVGSARPGIGE